MAEHTLFALRHVKSSWDDPGLEDHERPLASRGRRAAALLAEHVRSNGIRPDLVLCSSARRTRETLEGVAPGGKTLIEAELYDASCDTLLDRLRRIPEETAAVMVIGHNPALQMAVMRLSGGGDAASRSHELAEIQRKFPTGALATLALDCAWCELSPRCGRLIAYVRPKTLR
jgi:phosphohistidine phosphatase